ncbi:MAG: hypothetical protein AB3N63_03555 [Puniceicoccaceae bacterium]
MTAIEKLFNYASGRNVLVLFLVTMSVYAWILLVSIPAVLSEAPDLILFDMSPLGYSMDFAVNLLNGIGIEGRSTYATHQLPVDFIYPGLFAVTYSLMLIWALGKTFSKSSKIFLVSIFPVAAGVFDYLENLGIIGMLVSYPDISPSIVVLSSIFTILKSLMTVLFYILLLFAFGVWGYKIWAQRVAGGDAPR